MQICWLKVNMHISPLDAMRGVAMAVLTRKISTRDWVGKVTGWPIPVYARPKEPFCSHWLAGIVGSNPTGGMGVCLL